MINIFNQLIDQKAGVKTPAALLKIVVQGVQLLNKPLTRSVIKSTTNQDNSW